jgi:two-component system sensor histidine kinase HydH
MGTSGNGVRGASFSAWLRRELPRLWDWQALGVLAAVAVVTVLHYATPVRQGPYHDAYRWLYYVPIIYAGVRYGLLGGAMLSGVVSLAYLPHLIVLIRVSPDRRVDNVAGLVLFLLIGTLTGALVDAFRRKERLAAIGDQASRLVHDLRNPLTAIAEAARLMAQADMSQAQRQEMARIIQAEVQRLAEMTGEVLEYARGNHYLDLDQCRLNDVVKEAVAASRPDLESAGVELDLSLGEDVTLEADAARLQRVLGNLLRNAQEAMPEGGRVRVSTSVSKRQALIQVSDTGPGIAEEVAARLFDPFVTYGKANGTGLGLAIAREIVTAHGGELTAANSPGGGAVLTVSLPVRSPTARR